MGRVLYPSLSLPLTIFGAPEGSSVEVGKTRACGSGVGWDIRDAREHIDYSSRNRPDTEEERGFDVIFASTAGSSSTTLILHL